MTGKKESASRRSPVGPMISRKQPDGWIVFYEDGREIMRVLPPADGLTTEDVMKLEEHMLKLVKERQHWTN